MPAGTGLGVAAVRREPGRLGHGRAVAALAHPASVRRRDDARGRAAVGRHDRARDSSSSGTRASGTLLRRRGEPTPRIGASPRTTSSRPGRAARGSPGRSRIEPEPKYRRLVDLGRPVNRLAFGQVARRREVLLRQASVAGGRTARQAESKAGFPASCELPSVHDRPPGRGSRWPRRSRAASTAGRAARRTKVGPTTYVTVTRRADHGLEPRRRRQRPRRRVPRTAPPAPAMTQAARRLRRAAADRSVIDALGRNVSGAHRVRGRRARSRHRAGRLHQLPLRGVGQQPDAPRSRSASACTRPPTKAAARIAADGRRLHPARGQGVEGHGRRVSRARFSPAASATGYGPTVVLALVSARSPSAFDPARTGRGTVSQDLTALAAIGRATDIAWPDQRENRADYGQTGHDWPFVGRRGRR